MADLIFPAVPESCGSGLARDSGVSVSLDAADLSPSRAGSLLHEVFSKYKSCAQPKSPVGASLLAMAA